MSLHLRKFVAVLLTIWLPLFSSAVLASSVSMQMPQGACHEMGMANNPYGDPAPAHDQQGCSNCSICHLACGNYLGVQHIALPESLRVAGLATPYLFSYHSPISTPLLPPPLV